MPLRPRPLLPAAAAVGVTSLALAEAWLDQRAAPFGAPAVALAAAVGACAALAARWPVAGLLAGVALFPVPTLWLGTPGPGGTQLVVLMGLVLRVAQRVPPRTSLAWLAVAVAVPALTLVLAGETAWEFLFFAVVLGLAWAVGALLRRERARTAEVRALAQTLADERAAREAQVVAEERARISRELHDAVAHTLSVMTLQVGVVRRRLGPDQPREHEALVAVEELGRRSVDELRRIVGLVRAQPGEELAPAPSLALLEDLVASTRAAGVDVHLEVVGNARPLPTALDASAYRVVQEALSNAMRHAPGAAVVVRVSWSGAEVVLEVVDDGARVPRQRSVGGGHGHVGMRERVALFGGELQVGPSGRGYAVRATLPLQGGGERRVSR